MDTKLITTGLLASGLLASCSGYTGSKEKISKPNVLFILADDMCADAMGAAGNTYVRTPNIDTLAQKGTRFSRAYIMGGHHAAISAPSRAMLLTGKSLYHVYDKLDGVLTMPMHFAENGYMTFGTGKWHSEKSAFEASFQYCKNVFLGGMSNHFQVPCRDLQADGRLSEPVLKGFSTDVFSGAAMDFINEYAGGNRKKPFFCYVAFTAPHDPFSPRPDYIRMYADSSLPLPGNFMSMHPFEFDLMNIRDENVLPWPRTPENVRALLADYYALISHMDNKIGEIIGTLKKNGLFDNTIIVFAADNGFAIGSHGLIGKQNSYEHSTRVPLIITGPGIPEGRITDALVYLFDLFPTLSELCNVPPPKEIDGESLVPVIKENSDGIRRSVYTVYRNTTRAVRTKDWKLIFYPERNYFQLFNLGNDPLELNNLAGKTENRVKQDELFELLKEWHLKTNDPDSLFVKNFLPIEYDYTKLVRVPDSNQPEYTLKKYFERK